MKRIVLSGADGFVGRNLVRVLGSKYTFIPLSITDLSDKELLKSQLVDAELFIHLAGMSSSRDCDAHPREAFAVNLGLTDFLANLYFDVRPDGHLVFPSTSQVYASSLDGAISEVSELRPQNLYAKTKHHAELVLEQTQRSYPQSKVTVFRLFNHSHESQTGDFLLPSLLRQLKEASSKAVELRVGNLNLSRDLSSVQDLIRAFDAFIAGSHHAEGFSVFNIGSGVGKNLQEIADKLALQLDKEATYVVDPSRIRPGEPTMAFADNRKFTKTFSWKTESDSVASFVRNYFL